MPAICPWPTPMLTGCRENAAIDNVHVGRDAVKWHVAALDAWSRDISSASSAASSFGKLIALVGSSRGLASARATA